MPQGDLDELFGERDEDAEALFNDVRDFFEPDDFTAWDWLDDLKVERLEDFGTHVHYLGRGYSADGLFQVRTGKYAGAVAIIYHDEAYDGMLDEVDLDSGPDAAIESAWFLQIGPDTPPKISKNASSTTSRTSTPTVSLPHLNFAS